MAERNIGFKDSFSTPFDSEDFEPYPSWDNWKSILINFLKETPSKDLDRHLHEWYILRRRIQLNKYSDNESRDLTRSFSDEHSILFDDDLALKAFKYITEKTSDR